MTEIEKMLENANVYKMLCNCEFKNLYDYRIEYGSDVCDYTESKIKEPCKVCKKAKQKIKYYPDFTAEKQLELIKFLLKNYKGVDINKKNNRFNFLVDNDTFIGCHHNDKSFEESLAGVTNNLWQSLTDQEKEEIRRILNE